MRTFLALALAVALAGPELNASNTTRARPNIIVILADDMGAGDLGCYNADSKLRTPHMDALAAGGLRFLNAHSPSAVCSPTRYGLLTGRYAWRTRMKQGVLDGFAPPLIGTAEPNVASFLRAAGYRTACLGKWHLGMQWYRPDGSPLTGDMQASPVGFRSGREIDPRRRATGGPDEIGFETFFGIAGSLDMAPYAWIENGRLQISREKFVEDNRGLLWNLAPGIGDAGFEMTQVLGTLQRRAVDYIAGRAREKTPFFLYLPLNSPHLPVVPSAAFAGSTSSGPYGDFMQETDEFVGAIVAALRQNGLLQDTLVVVTSDNGGLWHTWKPVETDDAAAYRPTERGLHLARLGHHSNGKLRGTKADIYEGGHRVPLIVHWPAKIAPGGECAVPVELTDFFATVADIVEIPLPADAAPDSFSFRDLLRAPTGGQFTRPFLVHHSLNGVFAIRQGEWKYAEARGSGGFSTPRTVTLKPGEPPGQLYNLRLDPLETKNLAATERERAALLQELLANARARPGLR
jgi:arylsulfatase A